MTVERISTVTVRSKQTKNPKTLGDLAKFVEEAYDNGFLHTDKPGSGDSLIWDLVVTRND